MSGDVVLLLVRSDAGVVHKLTGPADDLGCDLRMVQVYILPHSCDSHGTSHSSDSFVAILNICLVGMSINFADSAHDFLLGKLFTHGSFKFWTRIACESLYAVAILIPRVGFSFNVCFELLEDFLS